MWRRVVPTIHVAHKKIQITRCLEGRDGCPATLLYGRIVLDVAGGGGRVVDVDMGGAKRGVRYYQVKRTGLCMSYQNGKY